MKAAGKKYDPVTYDGAGHGFMRAGEDPANTNPRQQDRTRSGLRADRHLVVKALPATHRLQHRHSTNQNCDPEDEVICA